MLSVLNMRLWLRTTWAAVQAGTYASLQAGLLAQATAKQANVASGLIANTAANGHATSFSTAEQGMNAEDWVTSGSYLLDLYDKCSAVLISSGIAAPTDAQIYAEMLFRLVNPPTAQFDFTQLRMEGV